MWVKILQPDSAASPIPSKTGLLMTQKLHVRAQVVMLSTETQWVFFPQKEKARDVRKKI